MGTSKGYIAPTTPHWSQAKRGVSLFLRNPTDNEKRVATARYAKAMNSSGYSNFDSRIVQAFSGITKFVASSGAKGYKAVLQEIGREDILELPTEEALNKLLLNYTNESATIDDAIALDCISEALFVLEVHSLEDLESININRFIKELVCQFAKHKFAQLFDKQIRNKFPNVEEANAKMGELQEYIYYTIDFKLTPEILSSINPNNLANEAVIQDTMRKGFEFLEEFYGE